MRVLHHLSLSPAPRRRGEKRAGDRGGKIASIIAPGWYAERRGEVKRAGAQRKGRKHGGREGEREGKRDAGDGFHLISGMGVGEVAWR